MVFDLVQYLIVPLASEWKVVLRMILGVKGLFFSSGRDSVLHRRYLKNSSVFKKFESHGSHHQTVQRTLLSSKLPFHSHNCGTK